MVPREIEDVIAGHEYDAVVEEMFDRLYDLAIIVKAGAQRDESALVFTCYYDSIQHAAGDALELTQDIEDAVYGSGLDLRSLKPLNRTGSQYEVVVDFFHYTDF